MPVVASANSRSSSSGLIRYYSYRVAAVVSNTTTIRSCSRGRVCPLLLLWIFILAPVLPPVWTTTTATTTTTPLSVLQHDNKSSNNSNNNNNNNNMGQAIRLARYDRASNERSAIAALQFLNGVRESENHCSLLEWFRLDDGVMGGQSETRHHVDAATPSSSSPLHFAGTINTHGGGFASIRCKISPDMAASLAEKYKGIKLRVRGDGKTYKFLLSDGTGAGPFSRTPSWQCDLPTENRTDPQQQQQSEDSSWQEVWIPFDQLRPSFAGGPRAQPSPAEKQQHRFDASAMREMGLMLSLKRADGSPNPKETFGEGIFPFQLVVQSIEAVE